MGRMSTPVCGMRVLNQAASRYTAIKSAIAASGEVSMPVERTGKSRASSGAETAWLIRVPPSRMPRMMEAMVRPSIQPLALTSWDTGSSSVRMPYLAGE